MYTHYDVIAACGAVAVLGAIVTWGAVATFGVIAGSEGWRERLV